MEDLESVVPHIPSENMEETIKFMVDAFNFVSSSHSEFYSELRSGNQVLGILPSQGTPNEQSIYLHVKDVDDLWSRIKSKIERAKPRPPFNQAYGMREFHIVIPATNTLLFVGSALNS